MCVCVCVCVYIYIYIYIYILQAETRRCKVLRNKIDQVVLDYLYQFGVGKSVHHHTIQINQPTRCNNFTSLLLDVYVWLNLFRAPPRPSSGAYNCISSLWFYRWSVGGSSVVDRGLAR